MSGVAVIFSGGLDSTTLLYDVVKEYGPEDVVAISFNYGQRHKKELDFAKATAQKLGIRSHKIIDLWSSGFTEALAASGSSLVTDTDVPEGHYAEGNMKQTVVPNRNMVMLSIAVSIAVAENLNWVMTGVHAGDHAVYPDCRPSFISAVSVAAIEGNLGFGEFYGIQAPYVNITKEAIAERALALDVPLDETWSCYKGGEIHCGKCGTCVERLEAINEALEKYPEFADNTQYADDDYWKVVTA